MPRSYAADAIVETCAPDELAAISEAHATAIICDSACAAAAVREAANSVGIQIPQQLSLAAVGYGEVSFPSSGYYVTPAELACAIAGLLRDVQITRPTVLWLNGELIDRGTISVFGASAAVALPNPAVQMHLVS